MNRTEFQQFVKHACAAFDQVQRLLGLGQDQEVHLERRRIWYEALNRIPLDFACSTVDRLVTGAVPIPDYWSWSKLPSLIVVEWGKRIGEERQEKQLDTYRREKREALAQPAPAGSMAESSRRILAMMRETGENADVCMWRLGITQRLSPGKARPVDYPTEWE